MLLIVPSEPLAAGNQHELEIQHAGKVIFESRKSGLLRRCAANWFPKMGAIS